jgi:hypothetical protein
MFIGIDFENEGDIEKAIVFTDGRGLKKNRSVRIINAEKEK